MIYETVRQDNNQLHISWLCDITQVSRSGYYNWLKQAGLREKREAKDREDFQLILEVYHKHSIVKGKGSRSIHLGLLHQGIVMNRKKVQRLMRKYGLKCPIRKANPHRRMAKAMKEAQTRPNLLNRKFETMSPKTKLLTDITYLTYGEDNQRAYLSTIKDCCTKQILSYVVSESLEVDFVLETVEQLLSNHNIPKHKETLIHSDQGSHYHSIKFQELLVKADLRQSMSRRGNCWDNAPQESFFGHMKSEMIDLTTFSSFQDLKEGIEAYMSYYNEERYQWELAKLSPNQYESYLQTGVHPLANLITVP